MPIGVALHSGWPGMAPPVHTEITSLETLPQDRHLIRAIQTIGASKTEAPLTNLTATKVVLTSLQDPPVDLPDVKVSLTNPPAPTEDPGS